jgi:ribosomal protein S18 acetylase RimI-like enzyme
MADVSGDEAHMGTVGREHILPAAGGRLLICPAERGDLTEVIRVLKLAGISTRQRAALELYATGPGSRVFTGSVQGTVVATAQSASFGRTGWLGNVAVDPAWRNRRIGTTMSTAAIDWLREAGVRTILLTATDLGKPVYERLGFDRDGVTYGIWTRAGPLHDVPADMRCRSGSVETALRLDAEATGEDRGSYLRSFAIRVRERAADPEAGYRIDLPWGGGPIVARDRHAGRALYLDMLRRRPRSTLAFPDLNASAVEVARDLGFSRKRRVTRMHLGPPVDRFNHKLIFNVFSLAVG